jgi:uncharacterized protein (DUF2141 family)
MIKITASLFSLLLLFSSPIARPSTSLTIQVDNVKSVEGQLWFGLYTSPQNFLQQMADVRIWGQLVQHKGSVRLQANDLPFGAYAVAVFHDQNGNGKLDQNMIGIPQEPYAFSQQLNSKERYTNNFTF